MRYETNKSLNRYAQEGGYNSIHELVMYWVACGNMNLKEEFRTWSSRSLFSLLDDVTISLMELSHKEMTDTNCADIKRYEYTIFCAATSILKERLKV